MVIAQIKGLETFPLSFFVGFVSLCELQIHFFQTLGPCRQVAQILCMHGSCYLRTPQLGTSNKRKNETFALFYL